MHSRTCAYCRAPIAGAGVLGRPWPGQPAATYCCFGCLSLGEQDRQATQPESTTTRKVSIDGTAVRLGIGILISGQSMIFGLGVNLSPPEPIVRSIIHGVIFLATMIVVGLLGGPLIRTAATELRRGRITIEALFLLTLLGAMTASVQSWLTGQGPIYFEVVSVLLVVYTIGRMIGARSRAAAIASTQVWASALSTCRILDSRDRSTMVNVSEIIPGDRIEVRPGESIAVDGIIRDGVGFVSEAVVSGEPFVVVRRPGDRVLAGMHTQDATFRIEATSRGQNRQIDRLIDAVAIARDQPISLQSQADRLGQIFLPLIVGVAISTFAVWAYLATWQTGLFHAMSVLLVACPCALGLATPIIIWSTLTRLAERGVIVSAGDTIERLARIDRVIFDKTGTLTSEQFLLRDLVTIATGEERARLLGWLAIVQEQSQHPIAKPFAQLPKPFDPEMMPTIDALRIVPGCGIDADLTERGQTVRIQIGRPEWIADGDTTNQAALILQLLATTGHRIDVAVDGHLVGIAMLHEQLRDTAAETIATLGRMRIPVEVLTGDTAERARSLELPMTRASQLPDDKRQHIAQLQAAGAHVLMVGDGINDASALATAEVGLALSTGTDLANSASAATLYHDDLRVIPWTIALARQAMITVRRNLRRAAAYNLIGITLAAFGVLHPIAAALLMLVSSLWIVWSSTQVGVGPVDCGCEDEPPIDPPSPMQESIAPKLELAESDRVSVLAMAMIHGISFALQGTIAVALIAATGRIALTVCIAFAIAGMILGTVWYRWRQIPHAIDMTIGMLTLGNLGMVFGWWADLGFRPMQVPGCACGHLLRDGMFQQPWMWLGMLTLGNLAMLIGTRRSHGDICDHVPAMFTGGNLGMLGGMWLGGWLAAQIAIESIAGSAAMAYLGMTMGMVVGMLVMTEVTRHVIGGMRSLPGLVRWMKVS